MLAMAFSTSAGAVLIHFIIAMSRMADVADVSSFCQAARFKKGGNQYVTIQSTESREHEQQKQVPDTGSGFSDEVMKVLRPSQALKPMPWSWNSQTYGAWALRRAAQSGNMDVVDAWLDKARHSGHWDEFYNWISTTWDKEILLAHSHISGNTPLHYAARAGHADIVVALLQAAYQADGGNAEKVCLRRLLEATNFDGKTAMTLANERGHTQIEQLIGDMKQALEQGKRACAELLQTMYKAVIIYK
eukprot:TRINITY_DN13319_c0_g2_i1.p1 TRINITY_DN13319_c0_g2~~TRINITY_DN13319_c0_g2_i1.p1  ORF type:complete len:246 (+),score=31.68 TRINITY_DN13319_c0_g2_i1:84-821(+)